ncbi:MAG TPA: ectonucleotide pyrophosphatase/phosphodiesterase [Gemmatimonadaceae bacterium]|nr:ectonucleotide pyrophosphatase/phosphodiesterase [Gemmatimonadaceae bacterium]
MPFSIFRCARVAAAVAATIAAAACMPAPAPRAFPNGSGGVNAPAQRDKPYVVLVSFDGFRADYLDRPGLPNFHRLARAGVRASGLVPVFPSKTFPNHYSIVTGLYAEHHGVVGNSFWDPARQQMYSISSAAEQDGSWYRGEPLWVTAERQGMVAASFFWPTSDAAIDGIRPTRYKKYDGAVPDSARVDSVLAWLALPATSRPHMVTTYFSDMDDVGHRYGPCDPHINVMLQHVDSVVGRLADGIARLPIADSVYLVLVSDHGMAQTGPEYFVALEGLMDTAGVRVAGTGPEANLFVSGDSGRAAVLRDSLNRKLAHGRAYLRADLPARFHYSQDPRAGDLVVVMDQPYLIGLGGSRSRQQAGTHGWDPANPSMRAILVIDGPGVRAGARIPEVPNVDIYPFITGVLGLTPAPNLDGDPTALRDLVMAPNAPSR